MKEGLSLQDMAAELERQKQSKRDFLVDTRAMHFDVVEDKPVLSIRGQLNDMFPMRGTAHQQFSGQLGIPKAYYDRMLTEAPDLLCRNLNHWLEAQPKKRLLRTLDGQARALLSDRYRPLDNYDLARAVIPKLMGLESQVVSTQITEDRFYLKAVSHKVQGEVTVGDMVQAGIVVSNSEVGQGSLRVEEMDYRLICLNGMIRGKAVRKAHLGRLNAMDAIEDSREFFRDETRQLEDRAFFAQVQDAVAAMFNQKRFDDRLLQYQEAKEQRIEDPVKAVEVVSRKLDFTEGEQADVLKHLIAGGDLSTWGIANAVTRASQDVEDYTRATELEAAGGAVIELGQIEW